MKREEEIKYASKDYVNYLLDKQEYHNENYTEYDIQQAFEEGALWADANPKNPWISVEDDLPCNHKELLLDEHHTKTVLVVLSRNDTPSIRYIERFSMINKKGSSDVDWYWFNTTHYTVTHWMPVPKLPNE